MTIDYYYHTTIKGMSVRGPLPLPKEDNPPNNVSSPVADKLLDKLIDAIENCGDIDGVIEKSKEYLDSLGEEDVVKEEVEQDNPVDKFTKLDKILRNKQYGL